MKLVRESRSAIAVVESGRTPAFRRITGRRSTATFLALATGLGLALSGCSSDADVASENLSQAAEDFKINRRVVFYNGITDSYILSIEGFCSVETEENNKLTVTCKVGNDYKKHFLGRSDNVTWFAEQLSAANVSTDHYKVFFKPSSIVPDVDVK
ncbi:beta-sandwich lipoprotein [Actinoplanes xinjiangensis]|uniref:Uncharacterized protein n=1 Tax=Actinoplanes xinjiangensis TaxID=512350 RepID=A0A316EJB7_9ACTN|nr:hypothetical protein [Actinoplanes xinjiangensis]PWK30199.1 hypothetical protein BC793_14053 [Actinoplanes xinjiangensis]GIF44627.1 hypothetical protein Axi01nite_89380 [Actinoplanes xinjiangensis]